MENYLPLIVYCLCDLSCSCHVFMFIICVFVGLLLYNIPNKRIEPKVGLIIIFKPCYMCIPYNLKFVNDLRKLNGQRVRTGYF